jgi:CRP-like cAMP-binding protein
MAHFRPGGKFVVIQQPIDKVPMFARLSEEERELVSTRLRRRTVAKGEVIFNAGQPSQAFYIISSGWVVLEDSTPDRTLALANLGAGGLLGEIDTLLGQPYATRARAASQSELLALSKNDLQDLIRTNPTIGLRLGSTLGMRVAFLQEYLVRNRLRGLELLSSLSESDLQAIAQNLDFRSFSAGDLIVEAGAVGDAAFILEEGQARLISESSQGQCFDEIGEGALFGHTALITGKPYPCTARAVSDLSAWVLPIRSIHSNRARPADPSFCGHP